MVYLVDILVVRVEILSRLLAPAPDAFAWRREERHHLYPAVLASLLQHCPPTLFPEPFPVVPFPMYWPKP